MSPMVQLVTRPGYAICRMFDSRACPFYLFIPSLPLPRNTTVV